METRQLGGLWPVSALTLGGGGVGQLWGETTREECIATVREAVDLGITLLDMAPSYGNGEAESVVGAAFKGNLPSGIRVTTKHRLGETDPDKIEQNIRDGLDESLKRLQLERVDLFFLHSNIIPHDFDASVFVTRPATRWWVYEEHFVPTCKKLVAEGKIGAWAITGIGVPGCLLAALGLDVLSIGRDIGLAQDVGVRHEVVRVHAVARLLQGHPDAGRAGEEVDDRPDLGNRAHHALDGRHEHPLRSDVLDQGRIPAPEAARSNDRSDTLPVVHASRGPRYRIEWTPRP